MVQAWSSGCVPVEWRNAVIVPVPKKGDLRVCDNWRGISLLDVIGKIFARIIQDRLTTLADEVLRESQCGFRRGRGCVDMIFVARQLIEKAIEHESDFYILFVDLKKAYDSVSRPALWLVLEKLGVPPKMLVVIKALHEGMSALVRVGRDVSGEIEINNGLRQGCTLAPMLFNLYFAAMMAHWNKSSSAAGFPLHYRIGRKLVGDRTAKSRLETMSVSDSEFADDAALYTTSRCDLETTVNEFTSCAARWGLTVSVAKTKATAVGATADRSDVVLPNGDIIQVVPRFTYLDSAMEERGSLDAELSW